MDFHNWKFQDDTPVSCSFTISCYMLFLEVTFVYPSRIPETV